MLLAITSFIDNESSDVTIPCMSHCRRGLARSHQAKFPNFRSLSGSCVLIGPPKRLLLKKMSTNGLLTIPHGWLKNLCLLSFSGFITLDLSSRKSEKQINTWLLPANFSRSSLDSQCVVEISGQISDTRLITLFWPKLDRHIGSQTKWCRPQHWCKCWADVGLILYVAARAFEMRKRPNSNMGVQGRSGPRDYCTWACDGDVILGKPQDYLFCSLTRVDAAVRSFVIWYIAHSMTSRRR